MIVFFFSAFNNNTFSSSDNLFEFISGFKKFPGWTNLTKSSPDKSLEFSKDVDCDGNDIIDVDEGDVESFSYLKSWHSYSIEGCLYIPLRNTCFQAYSFRLFSNWYSTYAIL